MLRRLAIPLAALALAACSNGRGPVASKPVPERGPVVVAIVIDALAAWEADERFDKLPASGGFARLRREGTYVRSMRYEHAPLDTAPGHAALYTGAVPRTNGIFANETIDRASGRAVPILANPRALRVETLADRLRAERPHATIVSLAIKDRAAILGGGRSSTASVWYDKEADRFVTSAASARELPSWARAEQGPAAAAIAAHAIWSPIDRAWLESNATPDAQPGEADYKGLGRTFPHDLAATSAPGAALRATPFADEAILKLALAAIDAPRDAREPLLVALSLSTNDYVGHLFGPDSWEAWDGMRRLDGALAALFAALDARFGAGGWAAIVTGDHGATPMPEVQAMRGGHPGERLDPEALLAELRAAARAAGFPESAVAGLSDPYVYLSEAVRRDDAARAKLVPALQAALAKRRSVARAFDVHELPAGCPGPADQSIDALVCRSVPPKDEGRDAAGDLYVVAAPGSFFATDLAVREGSAHGTPYASDRTVPLLVRAPSRVPAAREEAGPLEFSTFARTAAALLAIAPPAAAEPAPDLTRDRTLDPPRAD